MDFSYSKTEELFLQMIRSFAENEVKPLAAEVDETERFPMETVKKMAKLGLMVRRAGKSFRATRLAMSPFLKR